MSIMRSSINYVTDNGTGGVKEVVINVAADLNASRAAVTKYPNDP